MSVGTLFFAFLAFTFFIASVLIFLDNDKIILDKFKRFRDDEFYHVWRNFYGAGLLLMVSSFTLLAISFAQKEFNSSTALYLILGIVVFVLGAIIVFIFNKKALNKFDPTFYSRNNLKNENKKQKYKKQDYIKENEKRYENYGKEKK